MSATISDVPQNYGVYRWGEGYFGINAEGHATVCPRKQQGGELDLYALAQNLTESGLRLPVLVRFNDLLQHRVGELCGAFSRVASALDYGGGYRAVYPIKVNQQRSVVQQLVVGGAAAVGLEAGSKPELMAVLATAPAGAVIVCNGYKDRAYVRLALIGRRLGFELYIVIEKPSELELVLSESADLDIEPLLGLRVRLAAVAAGKWQNSGGAGSKFGLSAAQVLALIDRLRARNRLHWLVLLHSHIGSQIPDLRDIQRGMVELARYFVELHLQGVAIRSVDVGGGLAVDYEGTRSQHYCSADYDLDAYAAEVLRPIARACAGHGLPHPMVLTESGRAMTAHHAVLIADVIEREPAGGTDAVTGSAGDELLMRFDRLLDGIDSATALQGFQGAQRLLAEANEWFARGELGLAQRARAESRFFAVARATSARIQPTSEQEREVLEQLHELLAERVFCNFSLFQSIPDAWAIDQVFPVMPLHRLNERPDRAAVVHDLTCDSDGRIESFVGQDGVASTLMLHGPGRGEPYLLGIFLVGAYQEILGDIHNLFGEPDAVNVVLESDGGYRLAEPQRGDSADTLLRQVHFDPDEMLASYLHQLRDQGVDEQRIDRYFRELQAGLLGYTYLTA
jgi:arginine decarboxylase